MLMLAVSRAELIEEAFTLMLVGMMVVFCGLISIALLIMLINAILGTGEPKPASTSSVTTPASSQDEGMTPELIAVLTAAATAALHRPVRVVRARQYESDQDRTWVQSGRQKLMSTRRAKRG